MASVFSKLLFRPVIDSPLSFGPDSDAQGTAVNIVIRASNRHQPPGDSIFRHVLIERLNALGTAEVLLTVPLPSAGGTGGTRATRRPPRHNRLAQVMIDEHAADDRKIFRVLETLEKLPALLRSRPR
jgi:hypothetical protein